MTIFKELLTYNNSIAESYGIISKVQQFINDLNNGLKFQTDLIQINK